MKYYEQYVVSVYNIVKKDCENLDAIYKDYIMHMVGIHGFNALCANDLLEGCGVVNGRQLYALCTPPEFDSLKEYEELVAEYEKMKSLIKANTVVRDA